MARASALASTARAECATPAGREEPGVWFERLFEREYTTVVAVAQRILQDAHEAEDVAQEAFVQFHRLGTHDLAAAPSWLRAAAVHLALNSIRARKRRSRREESEALDRQRLDSHDSSLQDPQYAAIANEARAEVRDALSRLPTKHAAVLACRYSGLSYADIAATLDVPVGQIGTLLRRAEAALRKELTRATR